MPNEFTVIGEDTNDATRLLVVGTDGRYYGYFPAEERIVPVEPDDRWQLLADAAAPDDVAPAKEGAPS